MNPEIKARWVTALRSGKYVQGVGSLHREGKFCCLGVLCDLAVQDQVITSHDAGGTRAYNGLTSSLPSSVQDWAELNGSPYVNVKGGEGEDTTLDALNDSPYGFWTFDRIANLIEEQL